MVHGLNNYVNINSIYTISIAKCSVIHFVLLFKLVVYFQFFDDALVNFYLIYKLEKRLFLLRVNSSEMGIEGAVCCLAIISLKEVLLVECTDIKKETEKSIFAFSVSFCLWHAHNFVFWNYYLIRRVLISNSLFNARYYNLCYIKLFFIYNIALFTCF